MKKHLAKELGILVLGGFISQIGFAGCFPFGIAFFAAAYAERVARWALLPVILISMGLTLSLENTLKYGIAMTVTLIISLLLEKVIKSYKKWYTYVLAGSAVIGMNIANAVLSVNMYRQIVYGTIEGIFIIAFGVVLAKGVSGILRMGIRSSPTNEEIISISIIVGAFIYSLPREVLTNFYVLETFVYFIILFFGYKYNSGIGAIMGAACGIVLSFWNNDISLLGVMCLIGILAGIFRETGKFLNGLAYILGIAAIGVFGLPFFIDKAQIIGWVSGTILFMLIPNSLLTNPEKQEDVADEKKDLEFNSMKRSKLYGYSASFKNLAQAFTDTQQVKQGLDDNDMDNMFNELSGDFCYTCSKRDDCWKKRFKTTYSDTRKIIESIKENGRIVKEDIPSGFIKNCIYSKDFLEETVSVLERAKLNLLWQNRLLENRVAVAGQLTEMANIMEEMAVEICDVKDISKNMDEQIKDRLKREGVMVRNVLCVENQDKRLEVYMTVKIDNNGCIATREIAEDLSLVTKKTMVPSLNSKTIINKDYSTVLFEEDTNFRTLYGTAKTVKQEETISGDNYSFSELVNGKMVVCLSDGVGSGIEAYRESEAIIELMEQFLEAGFTKETAVKMINSTLVVKSEEQFYPTMDISEIDLYSGVCEFLKIGSSTTYIKRDNWVEVIQSTSLPIGVFHQPDCDTTSKKLYDGDFVIMITDGVLDAVPLDIQDEIMRNFIMEIKSNNPKEMAKMILDKACAYQKNEILDDMTVIVIGIWKK